MKKGDILEDVECPKCRVVGQHKFIKSWKIKGRGEIETEIQQFKCQNHDCRRKWRRGVILSKAGVEQ